MLKRAIVAVYLFLGVTILSGCGGSRELDPADPSTVKSVEPSVIQEQLKREESKKHLPKGAKIPESVMPKEQSKN